MHLKKIFPRKPHAQKIVHAHFPAKKQQNKPPLNKSRKSKTAHTKIKSARRFFWKTNKSVQKKRFAGTIQLSGLAPVTVEGSVSTRVGDTSKTAPRFTNANLGANNPGFSTFRVRFVGASISAVQPIKLTNLGRCSLARPPETDCGRWLIQYSSLSAIVPISIWYLVHDLVFAKRIFSSQLLLLFVLPFYLLACCRPACQHAAPRPGP